MPAALPDCLRCKGSGSYLVYSVQGDVLSRSMGGSIPAARPNPRSLVVARKWERSETVHPFNTGWQNIGCAECLGTGHKLRIRDSFALALAHTWIVQIRPWFRRFRQFRVLRDREVQ